MQKSLQLVGHLQVRNMYLVLQYITGQRHRTLLYVLLWFSSSTFNQWTKFYR